MDATRDEENASCDRRRRGHPPRLDRPGVYPVAPGVHPVPQPQPTHGLRAVNVYVAVIETRAHLELLVAQGRLASTDADGVTVYQEAGPRS